METLLGAALGILVGGAATRTHPRVNPGWALGLLAGVIGGLLGRLWWGSALTDVLVGQPLAGAVASGALGGLVFAPLFGAVVTVLKVVMARRKASAPSP